MEAEIPRAPFYRRERVPTVIQMEGVECGAACLCMILAYYEKYVSLEELRVACGIDRSGASLNGIMSAARMYELFTEGHLIGLEELYKMPLPLVAYWEFKHFVVIEGFSKDEIYINDPARGPYTISYDHLNRSFTGLVSLFTPSVNFVKSGHPYSIAWVLLQALKRAKIPFFFAFLTGLCLVIPGLAVPAFTQVFIDNILVNHIYSWEGWFFFCDGADHLFNPNLKIFAASCVKPPVYPAFNRFFQRVFLSYPPPALFLLPSTLSWRDCQPDAA